MRTSIIVSHWALPIFQRGLGEAGFSFSPIRDPAAANDAMIMIRVDTERDEELARVVEACRQEASGSAWSVPEEEPPGERPPPGARPGLGWTVGPMDDDVRAILGRPDFACNSVAVVLRAAGAKIPNESGAEQAAAIHYLLGMYAEHGFDWWEKASEDLQAKMQAASQCKVLP